MPTMLAPSRFMSPATTELSTPPLMATAMRGVSGIDGGEPPEVSGRGRDGVDERVDLFDGVAEAEREADGRLGLFAGEADGGEDVAGFDGAAGAGRTAGDGEAAKVERDDHRFAFDASEADVRCIGHAGGVGSVDDGLRDFGENALFEAVAEGGEILADQLAGRAEGGGAGDVLGARAAARFVAASVLAGGEVDALADVEHADALRGVQLVAGDCVEIDVLEIDGDFAGGLDAIGMEERAGGVRDFGHRFDVLDGAELVVGVHDGDERGVGADGVPDSSGRDEAVRVGFDDGDVEIAAGGEDGGVLNVRGDDVAVYAEDGEVVRFGAAAGENDFLGRAVEEGGNLAAGAFEDLFGLLAGLMDTGGIPESIAEDGHERVDHGRCDGRRCVVIEIKALHPSILPMATRRPLVTLTTDFGTSDHFVAAMKGVIYTICPEATVVDLTHDLRPFDVAEAAFTFGEAWRWFPKGTVHVAVVDPGVGSSRRPLLVEAAGQYFFGPDNGLLTSALSVEKVKVREVTARRYWLFDVSGTFHGRDVFAPSAAHLAAGARASTFGKLVNDALRLRMDAPVQTSKRAWQGTILKVDRFGNVITNFSLREFPWVATNRFVFNLGFAQVSALASHYEACEYGELYAVAGSSGFIEIVMREASAAKQLGVVAGTPVELMGWANEDA